MTVPVRAHGGGVETRVADLERKGIGLATDIATLTASAYTPSNGTVIGRAYAEYTTNADITAAIPADDTIPQVGEGTQILSVSITPTATTNRLRIRFEGYGTTNPATNLFVAAFVNGGANAVRAGYVTIPTANYSVPVHLEHEYVPGSLSAQTITIRVGPNSGTARMNGNQTTRVLGGAMACTLVVEEIKG